MFYRLLSLPLLFLSVLPTAEVSALTIDQFQSICRDYQENCDQHPTIQAYVGGALDLFATLNENPAYLAEINCAESRKLYNVKKIIEHMQRADVSNGNTNAMTVFIHYFEINKPCD